MAEGSLVTAEKATDQDQGPAGLISYSISQGNQHQFFLIDEAGDVRVASSPLLPGVYPLTIVATDHGSPPLSVSGVLTVTVTAVGEVNCHSLTYGEYWEQAYNVIWRLFIENMIIEVINRGQTYN